MHSYELIPFIVERFNKDIKHEYKLTLDGIEYTITSDEPDRFSGVLLGDLAHAADLLNMSWSIYSRDGRIYVRMH